MNDLGVALRENQQGLVASTSDWGRAERVLYPVRGLNRAVFGRCEVHPNRDCECVFPRESVASCGKAVSEDGVILLEADVKGRWSSGQLATCKSAWCCDFCVHRHQAEGREKAEWLARRHTERGGRIVHVTFTCWHGKSDPLAEVLELLTKAHEALRASVAWRDLPIADSAKVLQVKHSKANGWHPHFHCMLFLHPGSLTKVASLESTLRSSWNARLAGKGGRGGNASVDAREIDEIREVLYPWSYAPDDDYDGYYDPDSFRDADRGREWESGGGFDRGGSRSPWAIALAAKAGDRQSMALWQQFYAATKGRAIATFSQGLSRSWKARDSATGEQPEPVELDRVPVALVAADVWNHAWARRGHSWADEGLRVGRREGVEAMAKFWACRLGWPVEVRAGEGGLPFVYFPTPMPRRRPKSVSEYPISERGL